LPYLLVQICPYTARNEVQVVAYSIDLHKVAPKLRRAPELLRENGVRGFILKILSITKVYRRVLLEERDLDEPIPRIIASVPIVVDLLTREEVDDLAAFLDYLTTSEIRRRLDAGHLCFVARHRRRIVHASWATVDVGHLGEVGLQIRLKPDEAYLSQMRTAPEFRNKNVARARISWTLTYLHNAGFRRVISDVLPENKASQRASAPLGFKQIGWVARIILGPLKITLFRPPPKRYAKVSEAYAGREINSSVLKKRES
jgi:RimJ/RimL family protein N-acetyltransferase